MLAEAMAALQRKYPDFEYEMRMGDLYVHAGAIHIGITPNYYCCMAYKDGIVTIIGDGLLKGRSPVTIVEEIIHGTDQRSHY